MTHSLRIDAITDATQTVRVFTLSATDDKPLPPYTAGAHIDVDLGDAGTRSYSLIDWPNQTNTQVYTIAVQREESGTGGSKAMHALNVGDTIKVSNPANDFELTKAPNTLLLAGGIGITPMISMATALAKESANFTLHYAARTADVMAFRTPLVDAFKTNLTFHFDDQTPLSLPALMQAQSPDTHVYICGPKGMIDAARTAATDAGLPDSQIHIELFSSPDAQTGDTSFEVEIKDTGAVYTVPPGKTIIEVLEEEGVELMYDCQRGDCGICQTDVIEGTPDHRDVVLSQADKDAGNVMQICVSRAKSARLVLDL